jgi:hypothetical protein
MDLDGQHGQRGQPIYLWASSMQSTMSKRSTMSMPKRVRTTGIGLTDRPSRE